MPTSTVTSYSTQQIYNAVPQFIQDQDAANGYQLWYYIYGIASLVDDLNVLTRDNVGNGVHIEVDFGSYTGQSITDAYLAYGINSTQTNLTVFGTDSSWNVFNALSSFKIQIVDTAQNIAEVVTVPVPANGYNFTAPFVNLTGVTRGSNATAHAASVGADGSLYFEDYGGAPGWSQAIDITRCPNYALPWLAQFVGAQINPNSGLNRQQMVQKINQLSGFQRATAPAIVAELVNVTNEQLASNQTPLAANQVIVMENTVPSGNTYLFSSTAITLLVPSQFFSNYTYVSLEAASGTNPNYSAVQSYIGTIGGLYFSLSGSTTPSSSSPYVNFVYRYRPAGIQIFVGGY